MAIITVQRTTGSQIRSNDICLFKLMHLKRQNVCSNMPRQSLTVLNPTIMTASPETYHGLSLERLLFSFLSEFGDGAVKSIGWDLPAAQQGNRGTILHSSASKGVKHDGDLLSTRRATGVIEDINRTASSLSD